ncbi:MAG: hypothetical protein IJ470_03885 [Clostridia bacterium]|nr:hypothetical protein [Clostridia bacterium]
MSNQIKVVVTQRENSNLRNCGMSIILSGREALTRIREDNPDLIITDVFMPDSEIKSLFYKIGESSNENVQSVFPEQVCTVDQIQLERRVADIICEIGVPAHIKGYYYLRYAIILSVKNPECTNNMTKFLYPEIAKKYNTISSRVERAIRNAVDIVWEKGNTELLKQYFGNTVLGNRGKPTNSEFIAAISDKLKLELMI